MNRAAPHRIFGTSRRTSIPRPSDSSALQPIRGIRKVRAADEARADESPRTLRRRCSFALFLKRRNGPERGRARTGTGALVGRPGKVLLEKPNEQKDDHDERQKSATDVHSGLLCAVDVGTTCAPVAGLRREPLATMRARRRRGRVVRQRPAKPRTAVRVRSAPLPPQTRCSNLPAVCRTRDSALSLAMGMRSARQRARRSG